MEKYGLIEIDNVKYNVIKGRHGSCNTCGLNRDFEIDDCEDILNNFDSLKEDCDTGCWRTNAFDFIKTETLSQPKLIFKTSCGDAYLYENHVMGKR